MPSRRALLLSLCAASLPGTALAQPWWDERRRREEWLRWREEEMRHRRREAERHHRAWRRDMWNDEREHAAWERAHRDAARREWEERHRFAR